MDAVGRDTARTTLETRAMGAETMIVVMGLTATWECVPSVNLHYYLLELLRLLSQSRRLTVPVQTRTESVQSQWRFPHPRASSVKTVQAPDGTMYTEYTFPDGHEGTTGERA